MLFNSYEFIFLFLPIVIFGFFSVARHSHRLAALWLAAASLFFYGWWNPQYVLLLLASITFNYSMGYVIGHRRTKTAENPSPILIGLAITANLLLLGYFKYTNFFIETTNGILDTNFSLFQIILPLGISFYTFTQIAFLVDVHRGIVREYNFIHYILFVTYFPHLIAGPVLHHKQMMPQFASTSTYHPSWRNATIGISYFTIGLAKKVLIADSLAEFSSPIFAVANGGDTVLFFSSWIAALAFSFQLYFDFSGYSDMAIGLSKIFGIDLPINFNSPYRSQNIIEFWRRWHMTLSQFLKDYLYIPMGGNRYGNTRRYLNLMATMLLGGLWHGANWTFVAWGGLHGAYLMINHAWQRICPCTSSRTGKALSVGLTFLATVVAWVFFRADNFSAAISILKGMLGLNGISIPASLANYAHHLSVSGITISSNGLTPELATPLATAPVALWLTGSAIVIWAAPNSQEFLTKLLALSQRKIEMILGALGILFAVSVLAISKASEFLYFQF